MKLNYKYILLALLAFFLLFKMSKIEENFASSSPGALMQLMAYGAQDIYLTGSDGRPAQPMMANQSGVQSY